VDIAAWLHGLGLEQYEAAFRANAIDANVLPRLTAKGSEGSRRYVSWPPPAIARRDRRARRRGVGLSPCFRVRGGRATPADSDVLRPRRLHRTRSTPRSRGSARRHRGIPSHFGYPRAHEDDAERAVHAGLGLINAIGRLDVKFVKPGARVGIATGLVVVGDLIGEGSAQEQSVVGETPNLAARLQALADAGAVVIAAATRRLLGDLFEYRDLGVVEVKGIARPLRVWEVLRPSGLASRFEALHGSGLTPLVGRDEEIELLLRRWSRAKAADGQVVLIRGEAGLGKSALSQP
jgi:Adenylate and Guanylate cyclase catalytic domain/SAM domain (Sterile alpha motif)